jgi:shikimate dehydrogenase
VPARRWRAALHGPSRAPVGKEPALQPIPEARLADGPAGARDLTAIFQDASHATLRAALIGRGIQQSRTPRMHVREGRRLGLSYAYALVDFDQLGLGDDVLAAVIEAAAARGLVGLNVTHPFKQSALPLLDSLAPDCAAIGALNTIVLRDGRSIGHNTDCWGFAESFRRAMHGAALDEVLLIGAGGAGVAVARALVDLGATRVAVFDLDAGKAALLAGALRSQYGRRCAVAVTDLPAAVRSAGGLVNATPVGMAKYPGMPVAASDLRPELWVADIVYFPAETALLQAARARGCRVLPGAGMAIFQAVKAFELFTGVAPDPDEMARHFRAGEPDTRRADGPALT